MFNHLASIYVVPFANIPDMVAQVEFAHFQ
jgi:hypothetical protein